MYCLRLCIPLFKFLGCLKQFEAKTIEQDNRIAEIELKNQHQDEEMISMKRDISEHGFKIDQINVDK